MIAVLFLALCLSLTSIQGAEQCPGASPMDSQEDFKWKYDAASIVAYGTVMEVKNNVAKFQVSCVLKGAMPQLTIDLPQLGSLTPFESLPSSDGDFFSS